MVEGISGNSLVQTPALQQVTQYLCRKASEGPDGQQVEHEWAKCPGSKEG